MNDVQIHFESVITHETVVGDEGRIQDRSLLVVDLVEQEGVVPVERQLILQQRLRYVQGGTCQTVVVVQVDHLRVVESHRQVQFQPEETYIVQQHGDVGVGVGLILRELVAVVQLHPVEVQHHHLRAGLRRGAVAWHQREVVVHLEQLQAVVGRRPDRFLAGGEVAVGGIHRPVGIDGIVPRERAYRAAGPVGFRAVEVVALQAEGGPSIDFVLQKGDCLVEGVHLQVVVEEVASHGLVTRVDAPVLYSRDDRGGEAVVQPHLHRLVVFAAVVHRDEVARETEQPVGDRVGSGQLPVVGEETERAVEVEE